MKVITFIVILLIGIDAISDDCQTWFKNAKIKKDNNCLTNCTTTNVDMGTFNCPSQCDKLCKIKLKDNVIFDISNLRYGLTPAERALVVKYPDQMVEAFKLSKKANRICEKEFPNNIGLNDIADACRHFIWAANMNKKLGSKLADEILNAHEMDFEQPLREKSMDLANNRVGMVSSELLIKENKFNDKEILKDFKIRLKKGQFIILEKKQRGKDDKNNYY